MLRGYRECAELMRAAGAKSGATPLYAFLEAATIGDRDGVEQLLADDPTLADRAIDAYPDQLVRGAQRNSVDGVALLIDLGFDVNAINRLTATTNQRRSRSCGEGNEVMSWGSRP